MAKGKILYVNQEIMPFVSETPNAHVGRYLPAYIQDHGREIRVFMPRFSTISERKHQLHEVIRLSGMNLIVTLRPSAHHQVGLHPSPHAGVFHRHEEYFMKRGGLEDDNGNFVDDNDERILFFGRGVLEAVRKLAWQPHIIHFTGWFSCMIPFYLRRINKENAFVAGTRTVFSLTNDQFVGTFGSELERKMKADGAKPKTCACIRTQLEQLMLAAITYAHAIIIATLP